MLYICGFFTKHRKHYITICLFQQSSDREHFISTSAPDEEVAAFKI